MPAGGAIAPAKLVGAGVTLALPGTVAAGVAAGRPRVVVGAGVAGAPGAPGAPPGAPGAPGTPGAPGATTTVLELATTVDGTLTVSRVRTVRTVPAVSVHARDRPGNSCLKLNPVRAIRGSASNSYGATGRENVHLI
ncbi:hypothetical protein PF008_g15203 [Phytophthora fragariae]|uniref:Uncharacterized protein n=1 Tax=Phytophthora fragariae TaxID=53985 RepID=A0A6G0RF84_9STRA|nr:hypothetical protein PF008_g15203 [Phytophthora fragariae]